MLSNMLRSKKVLPLEGSVWLSAYKPLSNWTPEKWLAFQNLAPGSLHDGLMALHTFQKECRLSNELVQKEQLAWLKKAALWDMSSLGTWRAWNTLFENTPHWTPSLKSHLLEEYGPRLLTVTPEHYDAIAQIQDNLGRYWNRVQSKIKASNESFRRGWSNSRNPWETYNTFRQEMKMGHLLDHDGRTRWNDFKRLVNTPIAWQTVLRPLYVAWLQQDNKGSSGCESMQEWMDILDENKLDASLFPMPFFMKNNDYHIWSAPSSWMQTESASSYRQLVYLSETCERYLGANNYAEYPETVLTWVHNACIRHADEWTLAQKMAVHDLFIEATFSRGVSYFERSSSSSISREPKVHHLMLQWLSEHDLEFRGLHQSLMAMGFDFEKTITTSWGATRRGYTATSARAELLHYTVLLDHLHNSMASPDNVPLDVGHLFDNEGDATLGI